VKKRRRLPREGKVMRVTLLFVEDEIYTRKGILESVDWEGLGITRVVTACDGKEGMECLAGKPDIVLTDIRMPYHDGLSLAVEAKKNDADCEIIIMSAYSDKEYLFAAISLSTVAYIEKPVDLAELSQAVRNAVKRRRQSLRLSEIDRAQSNPSRLMADLLANGDCYSHHTCLLIKEISAAYDDPDLSVDMLAERMELNPTYISSVFRKDTGEKLKHAIIVIRLQVACEYLLHTSKSVADIALLVGYRSPNYFAKLFRREIGCSPNEYRDR
jgi:two-component system response regulator YesN